MVKQRCVKMWLNKTVVMHTHNRMLQYKIENSNSRSDFLTEVNVKTGIGLIEMED
jgi:hypothetical protein